MSYTSFVASQGARDGLTLDQLLSSLPTDPASVFVLVLVLVSIGLVIWFGRPRGDNRSE